MIVVLNLKATESQVNLDCMSVKLQTALQEEVSLIDKLRQLEVDKAALEERVKQLAGEGAANGSIVAELEERRCEVCRLQHSVEEHEVAAKQVLITFLPQ